MNITSSCNGTYSPGAGARIDAASVAGRFREQAASESANRLTSSPRGADTVDISSQARELSDRLPLANVRTDLVEEIRAEIAAGTYLTGDKLEIASDRLLQQLNAGA